MIFKANWICRGWLLVLKIFPAVPLTVVPAYGLVATAAERAALKTVACPAAGFWKVAWFRTLNASARN